MFHCIGMRIHEVIHVEIVEEVLDRLIRQTEVKRKYTSHTSCSSDVASLENVFISMIGSEEKVAQI